jgi:hypothetical protein
MGRVRCAIGVVVVEVRCPGCRRCAGRFEIASAARAEDSRRVLQLQAPSSTWFRKGLAPNVRETLIAHLRARPTDERAEFGAV